LSLTHFQTPDLHGFFLQKEASMLKSWDRYSQVIGAYSGSLETLLAIGGGAEIQGTPDGAALRFTPVVKYFPAQRLAAHEKATLHLNIGNYTGALRIMVVAASSLPSTPRAFGSASKTVPVRGGLMVYPTLPRVLRPGDLVNAPVTIINQKKGARTVSVEAVFSGSLTQTGGKTSAVKVDFDGPGEKTVVFPALAGKDGTAKAVFTASSAGLEPAQAVVNIAVHSTALPVTLTRSIMLVPGTKASGELTAPGAAGTNTVSLAVSKLPPLNFEKRLADLRDFDGGCLEQTVSRAFPLLFLENPSPENRKAVTQAITELAGFQLWSGGFSYWPQSGPSAGDASVWGTSYAGHFLAAAKEAGYAVPPTLVQNWLGFQQAQADAWGGKTSGSVLAQSYRLFTLAFAGRPDIGAMNRLRDRAPTGTALWTLAGAYFLAGSRDAARSLLAAPFTESAPDAGSVDTFDSPLRDAALRAYLLCVTGQTERSLPLIKEVSERLCSDDSLNTQETAWSLAAMLLVEKNLGGTATKTNAEGKVDWTFGGKNGTLALDTDGKGIWTSKAGVLTGKKNSLAWTLENTGGVSLYALINARGLPPEGAEPALSQGLRLSAAYTIDGTTADPLAARVGDDIAVSVTVANLRDAPVTNVALVVPFPASWEIDSTTTDASGEYAWRDVRDDRVLTYFNMKAGETKTFVFYTHNAYAGSYFMPAIRAFAMYDESTIAVIPGKRRE
jgi:uncharacterized protein YfaS (alpha-2-macroglobulin family)